MIGADYGKWLDTYDWDCWATLTFRYNPSPASALRSYGRWLNDSGIWLSGLPFWFVATEDGRLNDRTHLHALLGGLGRSHSRRGLWRSWFDRFGRAQILPYDQGRGASFYIAKYVSKEFGEWDVGGDWIAAPRSTGGLSTGGR